MPNRPTSTRNQEPEVVPVNAPQSETSEPQTGPQVIAALKTLPAAPGVYRMLNA
jgi:hypothetical protein